MSVVLAHAVLVPEQRDHHRRVKLAHRARRVGAGQVQPRGGGRFLRRPRLLRRLRLPKRVLLVAQPAHQVERQAAVVGQPREPALQPPCRLQEVKAGRKRGARVQQASLARLAHVLDQETGAQGHPDRKQRRALVQPAAHVPEYVLRVARARRIEAQRSAQLGATAAAGVEHNALHPALLARVHQPLHVGLVGAARQPVEHHHSRMLGMRSAPPVKGDLATVGEGQQLALGWGVDCEGDGGCARGIPRPRAP